MGSDFSLPSMGADPSLTTVYGFSCGSYMATNLNVVFSDTFKGAGLISGGPYMAEKYYPFGGLDTPLNEYDRNAATLAPRVIVDAQNNANDGLIDPLSNLNNMPIYIMSNKEDTTVPPAMHNAQRLFYENFGANIEFVETESRHVWPVDIPEAWGDEFGMPLKDNCTERGGRTIYNCGYDSAGIMLTHTLSNIDGTFSLQTEDLDWKESSKGTLQKFDQTEFIPSWSFGYNGLADEGLVYYPNQCVDGSTQCKVAVILHGGNQMYSRSGLRVIKTSGFGEYAPSNNLILLFPQVEDDIYWNFPGCWDFGGWGVSDFQNRYATNKGIQTQAIKGMVDKLTAPLQSDITPYNIFTGYSTWQDDFNTWMQENYYSYWILTAELLVYVVPLGVRYFWRVKASYPELWSQQTYWYF